MINISHLLPDEEMKELIRETGMGVESIDLQEKIKYIWESAADTSRAFPGSEPGCV